MRHATAILRLLALAFLLVLGAASVRAMLTPRFAASPSADAFIGLGFFLEARGDQWYYQHNGADEGFQCILIANARTGQGAAVMTNSDAGIAVAMEIVRGIFLNGTGFSILWPQMLFLALYGATVLGLSGILHRSHLRKERRNYKQRQT